MRNDFRGREIFDSFRTWLGERSGWLALAIALGVISSVHPALLAAACFCVVMFWAYAPSKPQTKNLYSDKDALFQILWEFDNGTTFNKAQVAQLKSAALDALHEYAKEDDGR